MFKIEIGASSIDVAHYNQLTGIISSFLGDLNDTDPDMVTYQDGHFTPHTTYLDVPESVRREFPKALFPIDPNRKKY